MSKSKILILSILSFAVGVFFSSAFLISNIIAYAILGISVVAFVLFFVSEKKLLSLIAVFVFFTGLGLLRMNLAYVPNEFDSAFDQIQTLEGYITEDPSVRENNQLLSFRPNGYHQQIRINTNLTQKFFYGDKIVVTGKIERAENFNGFDYQGYLERYNTYAVIDYPKSVLILESHQLNPVKEFLLKTKYAFLARLEPLYREPQKSLALGMLIGGKNTMPKQTVEDFNNTGTSHIIAVSGFNITIIATALALLAYLFGRRASFYLSVLTIIGFVVITGTSASAVRAGIMGILLLYSFKIGRQYSILPALFLSAFLMLTINPKILFWDIGFQLSFLATLGIIFFVPVLTKLSEHWPVPKKMLTLIFTTLAATLATLPVILLNFGTLSTTALLVNTIILPAVPLAMLFGFLSIIPFFGPGFAFVCNSLLVYMLETVHFFANIPYSTFNIKISLWVFWLMSLSVVGLYLVLNMLSKKTVKIFPTKIDH